MLAALCTRVARHAVDRIARAIYRQAGELAVGDYRRAERTTAAVGWWTLVLFVVAKGMPPEPDAG